MAIPTSDQIQNESFRLAELYRLELLDTPPEAEFDAIVKLGKNIFDCAFCTVALLDDERQWFKAKAGISIGKTAKQDSFCRYTIQSDEPYIVNDAQTDERVMSSPLVVGAPWIRSYLGIPLKTIKGARIGTFCLIDTKTREWSESELLLATNLAEIIQRLIHRHESYQTLGFKLSNGNAEEFMGYHTEFGAWELREDESLLTLSPSLRQMFGINDDLPIHKDWFERFGVNRPLNTWTEFADEIDGIEKLSFSILRPDGERVFFEETLYIKDTGKKKTLVGLVRRVKQSTEVDNEVKEPVQWHKGDPSEPFDISIHDFLRSKAHGYAVLSPEEKIIAVFDYSESKYLYRPPAVKLSDCFDEKGCIDILKQFDDNKIGLPIQPLFIKLKSEAPKGQWLKISTSFGPIPGRPGTSEKVIQFVQLIEQPEVERRTSVPQLLNELIETSSSAGGWYLTIPEHKIYPTLNACVLLGLKPMHTLSTDYFFGRLSEMTSKNIPAQIKDVLNRKAKLSFEFQAPNSMGDQRSFQCIVEPCVTVKGEVIGVRGMLRDISELRDNELRLFEMENMTDRVIQNLAEGVVDVDENGLVIAINHKALQLLNLNLNQNNYYIGALASDLMAMCSKSSILQHTQSMNINGSSQVFNARVEKSDNWISIQLFAKTKGFRVLIRNITADIHQQNDIDLFKNSLNYVHDAVIITNGVPNRKGDISVIFANHGFETLTGEVAQRWIGSNPRRLVNKMLSMRAGLKIVSAMLNHKSIAFKTTLTLGKDAQSLHCIVNVRPLQSKQLNKVQHLITIHRDVNHTGF